MERSSDIHAAASRAHEWILVLAADVTAAEITAIVPEARTVSSAAECSAFFPAILIGDATTLFDPEIRYAVANHHARILFVLTVGDAFERHLEDSAEEQELPIFGFLARPLYPAIVRKMLRAARESIRLRSVLTAAFEEINALNKIGAALSAERDIPKLLEMILQKSREITNSDAGALYLVEEDKSTASNILRFTLTQNDSVYASFHSFTMPIDNRRVASYVALTGESVQIDDVYYLPADAPYGFSKDFDARNGYRTKSVLAVPMCNHSGEIVGVLQLLNHKLHRDHKVTPENADEVVYPYPESAQHFVRSIASQAAIALENNRLVQEIQNLFEGFVQASVMAIEARDPTTSGHSFRVKTLTVALAEAVDRVDDGTYAHVRFSADQLREISYASVLHDFGKVGVREGVLVKANKLYPEQLEVLKQRFQYVRKSIQEENTRKRLEYVLAKGRKAYLAALPSFDGELQDRIQEIDHFLAFVLECNRPTVLPEGNFQRLAALGEYRYQDWDGHACTLLSADEVNLLSIPRGTLDAQERQEIESHVIHTFNFLSTIPWTKELRAIPEIARAHHEKLDGSGYPLQLPAEQIPIQSRMMAIADIFDALSASDRPYKKALSPEASLSIIQSEVSRNLLDGELYRIFLTQEIWKRVLPTG